MATIDRPIAPIPPGAPTVYKQQKPFFLRSWFALVLTVVLIVSHIIGWRVSEINPGLLAAKSGDIGRFIGEVLNPALISSDISTIELQMPVSGSDVEVNAVPYESSELLIPTIMAGDNPRDLPPDTPTYNAGGRVSSDTVMPGQEVTVSGTGWRPNTGGQVLWRSTGQSASVQTLGAFTSDAQGNFEVRVNVPSDPERVISTSGFANTLALRQTWGVGSPYPSEALRLSWEKIVETVFLALMGTTFAVVLSIPLSFLASRNLMSHTILGNGVYYVTRTVLNILRSIEVVIWAVIFAATVGLGPFAGMLALVVHSIASLGKLYSEAIESIDPGPVEALTATGANRLQVIMYAVVPQFIPQFLSFTMYRWDINVRMSTVIGIVGGGGIGFILIQYINLLRWSEAGTAIWIIAIVVILMDWISSVVRKAVI
ncbi:MAG TPA: phosphonate ABC transporter, permease protein PhnE [Chloroflexia bacterium]|jgi:phosphonate transport system permease protein